MKAKEYAEKYRQSENKDAVIVEIGKSFIKETVDLCEARHVMLESGMASVIQDMHKKWIKFVDIVVIQYYPISRPLKYNGYLNLLKLYSPEAYAIFMESKTNQ